jgi:hypothetical protein
MPPTTATETTTASSGMIPPRFFVLVRELRFGGSANFKISTLSVLCAVCSGVDRGGQRVNPSTHPRVSQARQRTLLCSRKPQIPARFGYFPAANPCSAICFAGHARAGPTNLFIQGGLALWVVYGFHRGSSNDLTVNIDERFSWI